MSAAPGSTSRGHISSREPEARNLYLLHERQTPYGHFDDSRMRLRKVAFLLVVRLAPSPCFDLFAISLNLHLIFYSISLLYSTTSSPPPPLIQTGTGGKNNNSSVSFVARWSSGPGLGQFKEKKLLYNQRLDSYRSNLDLQIATNTHPGIDC